MHDSVKRLLEVYEIVKQIAPVLQMFLYDDLTGEDLFYCAPAWSKPCSFFCQQFLSPGLESVNNNSQHNLAGMADSADGRIVLILLDIPSLW